MTLSDDEILYWFVECGVAGLATEYAAMNSSPEMEFRYVYFRKQYSLMLSIKPEWATRKRREFTEILSRQV
ncbi:immunity 63 family protein (plasmid) [Pseudocitrobacter faecalis]|nr:immunity 63 family protein [Pseudocitrobacter faecalis]